MNTSVYFLSFLSAAFLLGALQAAAQTFIGSESEWNDLAKEGPVEADVVLTGDITFAEIPETIDLGAFDFDGGDHTIRLDSGDFPGLFRLQGGHIRRLNLDLGDAVLIEAAGGIVVGSDEPGRNFGNLSFCSVRGNQPIQTNECGGIVGRNFGNPESRISRSVSSLDINDARNAGGIVGLNFSGMIRNCQMLGTLREDSSTSGGIIGGGLIPGQDVTIDQSVTIDQCVMAGDVLGESSGGIAGDGSYVRISNSIMTGVVDASRQNGSIIGVWTGYSITTAQLLKNIYATASTAPLIGSLNFGYFSVKLSIEDCFLPSSTAPIVGRLGGDSVIGEGILILNGVYGGSSAAPEDPHPWTVETGPSGYHTETTDLNGALGENWDSAVWQAVEDGYPVLKAFQSSPWVGYADDYEGTPHLPPQLKLGVAGGRLSLSWPAFWADWTLEECGDVAERQWAPVEVSPSGETTRTVEISTAGKPQCFYRLTR
ncbi:MAG: hypothetical protein ACLFVC_01445 [Opitutales bacterium]